MEIPPLTWLVMVRDIGGPIQIGDQPALIACMILDAETCLVRGISIGATAGKACADAMTSALTNAAGPLPPGVPSAVMIGTEFAADVNREVRRLLAGAAMPELVSVPRFDGTEDIFDSFLGHLNGRAQPEEVPSPADWRAMFAAAHAYSAAQPWRRWSDVDNMDLVVAVDGAKTTFVAVVIGQEDIQRGLILYPGQVHPEVPANLPTGAPAPVPPGTVLLWLDPRDEAPLDFATKALRYGWPDDADLLPICLVGEPDGPADLDQTTAWQLTLAATAVVAHDRRAPARGGRGTRTTGRLDLSEDHVGTYSVGGQTPPR